MTEYKAKLRLVTDSLRKDNGVFRASSSDEYNATWIRDNFWINLSYLKDSPEKYLQCCHTHLDFLMLYEKSYDHKLSWLIADTDVHSKNKQSRFIHPKVNFDGTEIKGLQWQFLQLDTLAYYVLMMWYGHKSYLEVFRTTEDRDIIQLVLRVIEALDICNKEYAHSWEEETSIFTSNLGLCMRALEVGYDMGFDINMEELRRIRRKFYGQFPVERNGRECDLTMLFLTAIGGIIKPVDIQNIIDNVNESLLGEYGVKRYRGDVYKPFDKTKHCIDNKQPCNGEMQWCMGLAYLAVAYIKIGQQDKAKELLDKLVDKYSDGKIPEGVNHVGDPCYNTPLGWSCAITSIAISMLGTYCYE